MKRCPTIGITALEQTDWPPYGKQRFFFEDMVNAATDLDLNFFFFSPFDIQKNDIEGWTFKNGSWSKKNAERPKLIYDRAFSALENERSRLTEFRHFLKVEGLKVLNPVDMALLCDNKISFHNFLEQKKIPTLVVMPFESLESLIIFEKQHSYFIKPISGSGGLGIFVVEKTSDSFLLKNHLNEEIQVFESLRELYKNLRKRIKPNQYFVQPKAKILNYNDAPIDLRVLIQNDGACNYQISGMAIRQGQSSSNVSNLNSGGTALEFEELADWIEEVLHFSAKYLQEQIKKISLDCCVALDREFGEFAEIGLDFLLTLDGPCVMEGNARPSRWVFNILADRHRNEPKKYFFYKQQRDLSVRMPAVYAKYFAKHKNLT